MAAKIGKRTKKRHQKYELMPGDSVVMTTDAKADVKAIFPPHVRCRKVKKTLTPR